VLFLVEVEGIFGVFRHCREGALIETFGEEMEMRVIEGVFYLKKRVLTVEYRKGKVVS